MVGASLRKAALQLTMARTKMVLQGYQRYGWHVLKEMQESYPVQVFGFAVAWESPQMLVFVW